MSCSLPRVPHQMPASLACSLGCRLLRKWTRWVEIGSRTDSAGTCSKQCPSLSILTAIIYMDFSQYTDMISVCGCCSLSQYANIHNAYHHGISGMMKYRSPCCCPSCTTCPAGGHRCPSAREPRAVSPTRRCRSPMVWDGSHIWDISLSSFMSEDNIKPLVRLM